MAKYVLAADYTLMTDYRNVPLATFFSCIPTDYWQSRLVFQILADQPEVQGRPRRARRLAFRLPTGDARIPRDRPHRPRRGRPFSPGDFRSHRPRFGSPGHALHERDGPNGRPNPENPGPDDARDERGHARMRPRLRVLRSHLAPAPVLPVRLHW